MTQNPATMTQQEPDIVVLRQGTEGLSTKEYAPEIRSALPEKDVLRAATPKQEQEFVRQAPVVTGVDIDENLLATAENLKLFVCAFSGFNHLPLEQLTEQEVAVTNASGIHAPGIAEQVIGNILIFSRNIHTGWQRKKRREWRHYKADELTGDTVTILGLGSIGHEVAHRLDGFGVETIGARYTPAKGGPTDRIIGLSDHDAIHEALSRTDYLVLSTPLTDETRRLIGREELITLPPEAVIINVSRGPVIDTDAMTTAIQNEAIRGAALDVTEPEPLPEDHPLWGLENVFITPHMGGHTPKHWERLAEILAENYVSVVEHGQSEGLTNQVLVP